MHNPIWELIRSLSKTLYVRASATRVDGLLFHIFGYARQDRRVTLRPAYLLPMRKVRGRYEFSSCWHQPCINQWTLMADQIQGFFGISWRYALPCTSLLLLLKIYNAKCYEKTCTVEFPQDVGGVGTSARHSIAKTLDDADFSHYRTNVALALNEGLKSCHLIGDVLEKTWRLGIHRWPCVNTGGPLCAAAKVPQRSRVLKKVTPHNCKTHSPSVSTRQSHWKHLQNSCLIELSIVTWDIHIPQTTLSQASL